MRVFDDKELIYYVVMSSVFIVTHLTIQHRNLVSTIILTVFDFVWLVRGTVKT